ncbi:MAG: heavy metal transporter [Lysobacterales bacterium 13-68-4]|uniref:heavy-metal-associated domain-containing protein n=1 Tax=Burkholderia sp. LMG 13014 TaxID=2709306 RepID=UPI000BDD6B7F|nr:heavy-metal-associated domain-containing protein [Burkholderia sp. LMG 13014]MCW0203718.1 heavy-metal-associated domain-containing protein [Rhodanobacter thiooxydans]OZB73196.1 MAG: heavy metal transporter [Xanthomonadales bacterium 13-68-4]
MISFEVKDMTCGHCVSMITKALKAADQDAKFTIDQSQGLVQIESSSADPKELQDAIADAGYTPVLIEQNRAAASASAKTCCGGGK